MMPLAPDGNYYANLPDGPSGSGTGLPLKQPNDVTGAFDDPNGNVTPNSLQNPAFYYKDSGDGSPVSVWQWSVDGQVWRPVVT